MTTEAAFLQTILNEPEDETVLLVFADWLEENGNPRGQFIRLQCQRSQMPWYDGRREQWKRQEKELIRQHRETWFSAPPPGIDVSFAQGLLKVNLFASCLGSANAAQWLNAHHNQIRELELQDFEDESLERAVKEGYLSQGTVLNLSKSWGVSAEGFKHLRSLMHLRALNLRERATGLTLRQLDALEELRMLDLVLTRVTDMDLEQLVPFQQLRTLDLLWTPVTDGGLQALSRLKRLQALNLSKTQIYLTRR